MLVVALFYTEPSAKLGGRTLGQKLYRRIQGLPGDLSFEFMSNLWFVIDPSLRLQLLILAADMIQIAGTEVISSAPEMLNSCLRHQQSLEIQSGQVQA